ncbi:NACHT, LRR and PYD domains-containing protein 3-like isoform X2 [Alosa pseudoharengus]|uniref:NACHT, LRR and PYD domains-containing protein 3-like isoform X2 n=1 Tax=Alosa pseudoharengus TaxID=34774 RepID=UPI003F8CCD04
MPTQGENMPVPAICSVGKTQYNELRVDQTEDQSVCAMTEQKANGITTCGQAYDEVLMRVKQLHKARLKSRLDNLADAAIVQKEHYITDGGNYGVYEQHEVWQVQSLPRWEITEDTSISCNDIFKPLPGQERHIRTVMTKGVAGIGKTVSVQKFILDWTDGVANQDVDFIFPLSFRELNLVRGDSHSLHRLLLEFHPELNELNDGEGYKDCQVVLIFDGLDESQLTLDLEQNSNLSDVKQTSSVDVLITSLIQGTLLPSALIWITSRPAAASQIPAQYIKQVTELRGFSDPQKEEYFRNRICDESQAKRIISHIKASRSLHIMCHIPAFCCIAATALQQMMEKDNTQEIPKTLTEMFIQFLLIQTNHMHQAECEAEKPVARMDSLLTLAELAFKHLEQGNMALYEEDFREYNTDIKKCLFYPGIIKELAFNERKIYYFSHSSVQEFLAALHVFNYYKSLNDNCSTLEVFLEKTHAPLAEFLEDAVKKALDSSSGHLDLFLHFLLGITLESNQRLLQDQCILAHPMNSSPGIMKICQYIKDLDKEDIAPEKYINLFHCLFEMKDHSLDEEIQELLKSPNGFKLSPAHCSALATALLTSDGVPDGFDLKKYNTSDEGRRRLLPAMRIYRNARLTGCNLSDTLCKAVASVLQSPNLLVELNLSSNPFRDSGVQCLSAGLRTFNCRLQTLRLVDCELSDASCAAVAAVLQSQNCLKQLDLSSNKIKDSGVQHLSEGLCHANCNLEILRLADCDLSDVSCAAVAAVLQSTNSLKQLDLSSNKIKDSGVQDLSAGLCHDNCNLRILRLSDCKLRTKSCEAVASVLRSVNSLAELDLSNNVLKDSSLQHLSVGLSSPECKLQKLSVKDCQISDEGFRLLSEALITNPSHLRELDIRYNNQGDSTLKLLSARLKDYHCALKTLYFFPEIRLRPDMQGYPCDLTLDPNTANRNLLLSEGNRKVTCVSEEQPYPDHPERFDYWYQVLCREGLSGRCYWEVEWSGRGVTLCLSYRSASRKGDGRATVMGNNAKSWMVDLNTHLAWHNDKHTGIPTPYVQSKRVRVDLDWPAGTLSFYSVSSSDTLTLLHTFRSPFTEPLYPGFGLLVGSTVTLWQITQDPPFAAGTPYTESYTRTRPPYPTGTPYTQTNTRTSPPYPTGTPYTQSNAPYPTGTPYTESNTPYPTGTPYTQSNTPYPTGTPYTQSYTRATPPYPTGTPYTQSYTRATPPYPTGTPYTQSYTRANPL